MILDHMPRGSALESKMEIVDITAKKESASASPNRERLRSVLVLVDLLLVRLPFMSSQVKVAFTEMK